MLYRLFVVFISLCSVSALAKSQEAPEIVVPKEPADPPVVTKSAPVLLRGGRILTAAGAIYENGHVLMQNGRIISVGSGKGIAPHGATVVDTRDSVITPGIIDTHSHLGVYAGPAVDAHSDGNEATRSATADVWAEHSFWPHDPNLWRAVSGGTTTIQVLPGSANLIGGRTFIAKIKPKTSARAMRFPGAPQGLKIACGENPKRVYKDKGGPSTRMGNVAGYRGLFQQALEYRRKMKKFEKRFAAWEKKKAAADKNTHKKKRKKKKNAVGKPPIPPTRNFALETLAKVLDATILPHIHCYRADEMSIMLDIAEEFGFKIRSFHHANEAYKIKERLAKEQVGTSTWADWWGFKMEAFDATAANAAILEKAGAPVIIHSDSAIDIRMLNQEAAKAAAAGLKLGIDLSEDQVLRWITYNAAWALGVEDKVGSLEVGKMADVVVWDGHPFSVYAKTKAVFIDGEKIFDRKAQHFHLSDFELGQRSIGIGDSNNKAIRIPKSVALTKHDIRKNAPVKANSFAITNATIELGYGKTLKNAHLVVRQGKISSVGTHIKVPTDMPTINGKGKVVAPGFIGVMNQLGQFEVGAEQYSNDWTLRGRTASPAFDALDSFNPATTRIAIAREHGITSTISSPLGELLFGMGFAFDLTDENKILKTIAPRVAMFGSVDQYAAYTQGGSRGGVWLRLREIIDDVRWYRKNPQAYATGQSRKLALTRLHLKAMLPVLKGQMPLVLWARRASDIRNALKWQRKMKQAGDPVKLILVGANEGWKVAREIAQARVPVIYRTVDQTLQTFEYIHARDDGATLMNKAGVKIILSEGGNNMRRMRQEAGLAIRHGLPKSAAWRAVTLHPAQAFGKSKSIGSLQVGKRANIVLWSDDPFELLSHAERMWVDGKELSLENRQHALARRYLH